LVIEILIADVAQLTSNEARGLAFALGPLFVCKFSVSARHAPALSVGWRSAGGFALHGGEVVDDRA
jgi:hypothetical protein